MNDLHELSSRRRAGNGNPPTPEAGDDPVRPRVGLEPPTRDFWIRPTPGIQSIRVRPSMISGIGVRRAMESQRDRALRWNWLLKWIGLTL